MANVEHAGRKIYTLTDEVAQRMAAQVPGAQWTVGTTVERMASALKPERKGRLV